MKTQPWTVRNGRVRALDGRWLTPAALLRRVRRHILAHPRQYDQNLVICDIPDCKTIACIGGWACLLTTGEDGWAKTGEEFLIKTAGSFIGAYKKENGWPWLFDCGFIGGPEKVRDRLLRARTYKKRAEAAAYAITAYIKERL